MNLKQLFYLPWWFFQARFFGRKRPLQTVLFISDRCNLKCKHCSVYQQTNPHNMTFDQVREHLVYSYQLGSRYVDFEGGEVMLWRDGTRTINDLIDEAKRIGFSVAQLPPTHNCRFKTTVPTAFGSVSAALVPTTRCAVKAHLPA